MSVILYGISNCDTVRKARRWLEAHGQEYAFHDIRRQGLTREQLAQWVTGVGWEALLNRRGMTWRKLPADAREEVNEQRAMELMLAHPTLIKRPVLEYDGRIIVGFSEAQYANLF